MWCNYLSLPLIFALTSKETASYWSRHASWHVRHARAVMHFGIANTRWREKRSRQSRQMRNLQLYVSDKRPMWCVIARLQCVYLSSICSRNSRFFFRLTHKGVMGSRLNTPCHLRFIHRTNSLRELYRLLIGRSNRDHPLLYNNASSSANITANGGYAVWNSV